MLNILSDVRERGKADELAFWSDFVKSDRFLQNWCVTSPNPELQIEIDLLVKAVVLQKLALGERPKVLDVGSGPVSILNGCFPRMNVDLYAADPLGSDYLKLWDNPFKNLVCKPIACNGEELVSKFGSDVFDIVHIRNAIDHSINPLIVMEQMIAIAKRGGFLIVHGCENEADAEGWVGFHQWNLRCNGTDIVVSGADGGETAIFKHFATKLRPLRAYGYPLGGKGWCGLVATKL